MNSQYQDLIKSRKKLADDLEKKNRESKFFEKQCQECQRELQCLRGQLEKSGKVNFGNASSYNTHQVFEQVKQAKTQNDQLSARLILVENELHEKNIRVKVLEDALAFRSEEIGLTGHGDLLRRIVQLKGELKGAKEEFTQKSNEANSLEQDNGRLTKELQLLQQQMGTLQERLAQSQQDLFKFSNADVVELLKRVEKERDLLLEYSQQDMTKSTNMANRIEQLESEISLLRNKEQGSETALKELLAQNEHLHEQLRRLQDAEYRAVEENKSLHTKLRELEQVSDSLKLQLEHKLKAEDEIVKHQLTLSAQLRAKDKDVMLLTEEVTTLRAKVEEQDKSLVSAHKELSKCHSNIKDFQEEISCFKNKSVNLESENRVLSLNVSRLELENCQLKKSLQEQSMELLELRPLKLCLDDLSKDLDHFDEDQSNFQFQNRTQNSNKPITPTLKVATTTPVKSRSSGNSAETNELLSQLTVQSRLTPQKHKCLSPSSYIVTGASTQHLSLSQQHSVWIGLPSIRKIHSKLYENIRKLAHDLHMQETRCKDLQHQYDKLLMDSTASIKDSEGKIAYLSSCYHSNQESITFLNDKLYTMETDYRALQNSYVCLNQIRTIVAALSEHPFLSELKNESDAIFQDRMIEGKKVSLSHLRSFLKDTFEVYDSLSDNSLSLFIEKLLGVNVQSIMALKESLQAYDKVEKDIQFSNNDIQRLRHTTHEQSLKIQSLEQEMDLKTNKLHYIEADIQKQLTIAADLAEKQNSLVMSLEAKLEGLQRDCQLKKAQIVAIHHREEALKNKLFLYFESISRHIPTNNPDISELVQLLIQGSGDTPSAKEHLQHTINTRLSISTTAYDTPHRRSYMDKSELESLHNSTSNSRVSSHKFLSPNEERLSVSKLSKSFSDRLSSHHRINKAENIDVNDIHGEQQSNLARPLSACYSSSNIPQAIQERMKRAQETFRAIRDLSSKTQ